MTVTDPYVFSVKQ